MKTSGKSSSCESRVSPNGNDRLDARGGRESEMTDDSVDEDSGAYDTEYVNLFQFVTFFTEPKHFVVFLQEKGDVLIGRFFVDFQPEQELFHEFRSFTLSCNV